MKIFLTILLALCMVLPNFLLANECQPLGIRYDLYLYGMPHPKVWHDITILGDLTCGGLWFCHNGKKKHVSGNFYLEPSD
jgi:hypothetical protein